MKIFAWSTRRLFYPNRVFTVSFWRYCAQKQASRDSKIYWIGDAIWGILNYQNFEVLWSKIQFPNKSDNKTKEMFLAVSWTVLKEAVIRSGMTKLPRTHNLSRTCSVWITSWILLNYLNHINAKCGARILIVVMFDNIVKIKSQYLGVWEGRNSVLHWRNIWKFQLLSWGILATLKKTPIIGIIEKSVEILVPQFPGAEES